MKAEYIDHLGDDLRVVNAARVSFDKESEWGNDVDFGIDHYGAFEVNIKVLQEKDIKLLNYLAKHGHWTPFSHVMITMRETVPIFVARQRFKHMVGFTYNEVSRRYVDDEPTFYTPSAWRKKAENKKQGSSDEVVDLKTKWANGEDDDGTLMWNYSLDAKVLSTMLQIRSIYESLLKAGVAPEQARMILPQSMYTSYYVTGSLSAWARAYKLRIDPHAQKEIQDLAHQWRDIIGGIPELKYSWEALTTE